MGSDLHPNCGNGNGNGKNKGGKGGLFDVSQKVVVAVKASKEISRVALVWSLTQVAQPGDCITLLVVVPAKNPGRKRLWSFPRFSGDCASSHRKKLQVEASIDMRTDLKDSFSQMMLQLHDVYDPDKINVKIKIVSGYPCGAVAMESKSVKAAWVVLDRHLKSERRRCMEELQCNIVVMKHSKPKVLRLNLVGSCSPDQPCDFSRSSSSCLKKSTDNNSTNSDKGGGGAPNVTPTSSPELDTYFTSTEVGTPSVSSSDPGTSPFFISDRNYEVKKDEAMESKHSTSSRSFNEHHHLSSSLANSGEKTQSNTAKALMEKLSKLELEAEDEYADYNMNVREIVPPMSRRNPPLGPAPLCSVCKNKAPVLGKPPRSFTYAELEVATGGFCEANFLAEGGFGSVHRGVLQDGQSVAVKQHKLASSQGDHEFCSEVEVLSCAQHRNVVTLIGFCVENRKRLLVYEYICNGSLDSHLYGRNRQVLEWSSRHRIAVGAAKGLRYLHEECRVGCIVHRDMRPNNILITHDFKPLVGDFGLARWQPDGDLGVETRVIGTFGYLAPEYAESGQITEKADVYSFGVVLVELVTGRKAVDLNRPKRQQCLTEWARPLLEKFAIGQLIDPRLNNGYSEHEAYCMLHAASMCIRRDPYQRPRMSQVLRILEGDMIAESNFSSTPLSNNIDGWKRHVQTTPRQPCHN